MLRSLLHGEIPGIFLTPTSFLLSEQVFLGGKRFRETLADKHLGVIAVASSMCSLSTGRLPSSLAVVCRAIIPGAIGVENQHITRRPMHDGVGGGANKCVDTVFPVGTDDHQIRPLRLSVLWYSTPRRAVGDDHLAVGFQMTNGLSDSR